MVACLGGLVVTTAVAPHLRRCDFASTECHPGSVTEAERAEIAGEHRLFGSLLEQARASRLSKSMGQRFNTLAVIGEAALARSLELGEDEFRKLRSEAASAMALTDLSVDREWPGWPAGSSHAVFDGDLNRILAGMRTEVSVSARLAMTWSFFICPAWDLVRRGRGSVVTDWPSPSALVTM